MSPPVPHLIFSNLLTAQVTRLKQLYSMSGLPHPTLSPCQLVYLRDLCFSQFTFHLSGPSLLLTTFSTSCMLTIRNCSSVYLLQIPHFLSLGSNPSSLNDLYCWLSHNGLCLNPPKSDAVLFSTQQRLRTFPPITSINIAGSVVNLCETVSTLGVNLD